MGKTSLDRLRHWEHLLGTTAAGSRIAKVRQQDNQGLGQPVVKDDTKLTADNLSSMMMMVSELLL
jgi:hypothetical protein